MPGRCRRAPWGAKGEGEGEGFRSSALWLALPVAASGRDWPDDPAWRDLSPDALRSGAVPADLPMRALRAVRRRQLAHAGRLVAAMLAAGTGALPPAADALTANRLGWPRLLRGPRDGPPVPLAALARSLGAPEGARLAGTEDDGLPPAWSPLRPALGHLWSGERSLHRLTEAYRIAGPVAVTPGPAGALPGDPGAVVRGLTPELHARTATLLRRAPEAERARLAGALRGDGQAWWPADLGPDTPGALADLPAITLVETADQCGVLHRLLAALAPRERAAARLLRMHAAVTAMIFPPSPGRH